MEKKAWRFDCCSEAAVGVCPGVSATGVSLRTGSGGGVCFTSATAFCRAGVGVALATGTGVGRDCSVSRPSVSFLASSEAKRSASSMLNPGGASVARILGALLAGVAVALAATRTGAAVGVVSGLFASGFAAGFFGVGVAVGLGTGVAVGRGLGVAVAFGLGVGLGRGVAVARGLGVAVGRAFGCVG